MQQPQTNGTRTDGDFQRGPKFKLESLFGLEKSQFLRLKSSEIRISSWLTHAKSFFPMVDPSNPHRFFLPPGPTRVMKQPRDARVAVGGWRLFDLVVQVNELALTTFVPGDTLGKPRKLMGKNRKHVGAERE